MSPSPSAPDVESPSSPTSPSPKGPAALPPTSSLFLPPKGPAAELPPPSSSTSSPSDQDSASSPSHGGEAPTWSAGYAESEATSDPPGSSDTPSTGKPPLATRSGLRAILGQAVRTVTNAVAVIAADATEQQFGLWRADKDDVDGISGPAARIVYRRLPEEARDSDTLDLFSIGLAVAGYVAKHIKLKSELRAMRATGQLVDVDQHTGVFVPSGDAVADAAAAEAWGVPGYGPAAAATS